VEVEFLAMLLAVFHWKINPMAVCGFSDIAIDWITLGASNNIATENRLEIW